MKKILIFVFCLLLCSCSSKEVEPIVYDKSSYELNSNDTLINIDYKVDKDWKSKENENGKIYTINGEKNRAISISITSDLIIAEINEELWDSYIDGLSSSAGIDNISYELINVNGYDGIYSRFNCYINNEKVENILYVLFINGELVNITYTEEDSISPYYFDCALNVANSIIYTGDIITSEGIDESDEVEDEANQVSSEVDENPTNEKEGEIAVSDPKATEVEKNSSQKVEEESKGHFTKDGIPILGTSLDTVMSVCKQYGVTSMPYDDTDCGDGTYFRDVQTSKGGMMMTIIYVKNTKEVVSVDVVPNLNDSKDDQKKFIVALSKVCCPFAKADEVSTWVSNNLGKKADTTIDGIVYTLHIGNCDNICFTAGEGNWEDWVQ